MSTILDALQKAQRARGAEPPGAVAHPTVAAKTSRSTLLVGGIIAIALLLIAGALWRIAVRSPVASQPPGSAVPAPSAPFIPPSAAPTRQQSALEPATIEPVAEPVSEPAAALDAAAPADAEVVQMHYQTLDDVAPVYQGAGGGSGAVDAQTDESHGLSASADATSPQPPTTVSATPDTSGTPPPAADTPPRWNASRQPQLAALSLQVHVYDADPARRWIMVDGHRINEGGSLPTGGTLEEIRADGLVIRVDGETVWWPLGH